VALLHNPQGLSAALMCSHTWGEDLEELHDAIIWSLHDHSLTDADPALWVCLFAIHQARARFPGNPGPTIEDQLAVDPFGTVVATRKSGGGDLQAMLAVHTTRVDMYTRLWCPYELYQAQQKRLEIWMGASTRYEYQLACDKQYLQSFAGDESRARELHLSKLAVDTSRAGCSSPEDAASIRRKIMAEGGFKMLDAFVLALREQVVSRSRPAVDTKRLKAVGFNCAECKAAGFSCTECETGGFSCTECKAAGFSCAECKTGGFSCAECKAAGFSCAECKTGGFSCAECKAAGFSCNAFKAAGFSPAELLAAGMDPFSPGCQFPYFGRSCIKCGANRGS